MENWHLGSGLFFSDAEWLTEMVNINMPSGGYDGVFSFIWVAH